MIPHPAPAQPRAIHILLHDIRSVHNVGSIFRIADCLGATYIYMSGYTPLPVDRFERKRQDFAKVALGAESTIPWEQVADPLKCIEEFRRKNPSGQIIVLEQDERAVDYRTVNIAPDVPVLFIVGNEVEGVPSGIRDAADVIAVIPQWGTKESLNVAVAAGVAMFRMFG